MNERKMIQIATPFMGDEEWHALREPIESGWLTQGPKVAQFEKAFAQAHHVKHAIATSNCTTALHLALLASGIEKGQGVIVPSFTWIATANAVEYCGAIPIFCDIDLATYNIASAESSLKWAQKKGIEVCAIIPVHLFGLYADMDQVVSFANQYNLKIIEDAACASGANYKGRCAGDFGDVGCFSFHPRKVLVTGEGGMCTTNSDEMAQKINCLRNHGASISEEQRHHGNAPYRLPDFDLLGFNYRMSDLQGAVGYVQLQRLETMIQERERWASFYDRHLASIPWIHPPARPQGCKISWQAYVCRIEEAHAPITRNKLMELLFDKGISTRPGTHAVHMLGYYRERYDLTDDTCPKAKQAYEQSIALPLHNKMNDQDFQYIIETLMGADR